MNADDAGPRPWLAGALALAITGAGHAYLRRWARALGWLLLAFAVTITFVPESAVLAFAEEGVVSRTLVPTFVVVFASVVDAYVLARRLRDPAVAPATADDPEAVADDRRRFEEGDSCPECGREIDPELDFCPWCSAELAESDR